MCVGWVGGWVGRLCVWRGMMWGDVGGGVGRVGLPIIIN